VVLYAKDLGRLRDFYVAVLGLQAHDATPSRIALQAGAYQLTLIAIPARLASDIIIKTPPALREETPIKLVFRVPTLAEALAQVAAWGGVVLPDDTHWRDGEEVVADVGDPEGNVVQLRAPASITP
jgi:predicted enzyme related to lactoylglutathione lyase